MGKISYSTPDYPDDREEDTNFELDKLKEEFNKINKTENLEIGKLEEKIKSSKDEHEIILLSKMIIEIEPKRIGAYFHLASSLMKLNQVEEAEKWYRKLTTIVLSMNFDDKSYVAVMAYFGFILYKNKKYAEAVECFNKVLERNGEDLFTLYWKCVVLHVLKKFNDALHLCETIIKSDKIDERHSHFVCVAWTEKSDIQNSLKEYENALTSINEAISIDVNNSNAWIGKGFINQNLGNHQSALECFEKALALDEDNVVIMNSKGLALAELERFVEAKKCFMDIISIDKFNSRAWANLAGIHVQIDMNFIKSLECSAVALAVDPDNVYGLHARVVALTSFKRFDEALEITEKILSNNKNYLEFIEAKVLILANINLKPKALEYIDEVLSRNFFKGNKLVTILLKKSMLLNLSQEFEKMMIVCNDVLTIDENNEEALIGKCGGLKESGKLQECLDCCNELLTINENSLPALNVSSIVLEELGRTSESIENYKKMLAIDENSATALYNLSNILATQEKYPDALKYINRFIKINPTGPDVPIKKAKKLRDKLIEQNESK